jgi:hypothetical protein
MMRRFTSSGLHVKDGDADAFGHDRRQAAVGVAQNEQAVGLFLGEQPLDVTEDGAELLAEGALRREIVVGQPHLEFAEEHFA